MDHFPIFGHLLKPTISVKLLDEVPYDNEGFLGFEKRAGFDQDELAKGLFVGNSSPLQQKSSRYASLIQSWWYWGLLHECLQQPVQIHDFLESGQDGSLILTTKHLEHELVQWAQRLQNLEADHARYCIRTAQDSLGRVKFLLTVLTGWIEKAPHMKDESNRQFWLLHGPEILPNDLELSISALAYALDYTVKAVSVELGVSDIGPRAAQWPTPPGLIRTLEYIGFCKSDSQMFEGTYGFVTALMALTLPDLNRRGDHSQCTSNRCEADNIKPDKYERKHVADGCTCSDLTPERDWSRMLDIVEGGGIPLVRLKPQSAEVDSDIDFEVLSAEPDIKYVAYSHVWADGRGNVHANGLFKCQWRWLQECAQKCQSLSANPSISPDEIVPFWIDTFCVPRGSGQRVAKLRTKSILMMPEIYRGADVVLVLDHALENAGDMSLLQFGMRLNFCGWSRRVWTLHEGAVAKNLFFRMASGLCGLRTYNSQLSKATYPLRSEGEWRILQGIEAEYIHAVFQNCLMINQFGPSPEATFFLTWEELRKRSTSLPNDRYLVLGIINQVSKETLLELQRSTLDRSDPDAATRAKLKSVLLSTPVIPQSIIFTIDKRFPEPGMQWAPSFIGAEIPTDGKPGRLRYVSGKGVIVKYKGWRIANSVAAVTPSTFMFINVGSGDTWPRRCKIGLWPTSEQTKNFATLFPSIDRNATLSIILSYVPNPEDSAVDFKRALLVEELGGIASEALEGTEGHNIIHGSYLALLRLYNAPEGDKSPSDLSATWVNHGLEQLWCVG